MADYGIVTVVAPTGQDVVVNFTHSGGATAAMYTDSTLGSQITLPFTVTSGNSKQFFSKYDGTHVLSAKVEGVEVAGGLGQTRTIFFRNGQNTSFSPSLAGALNTYFTTNNLADLNAAAGTPSGTYLANMGRLAAGIDGAALTTQVMTSCGIYIPAGTTVTNLTFVSGGTAAGTPTNWWFALYDNATTPNLLAQTADQTTTAWGTNTAKTVALATPQTIATSGWYNASVMVKATTPPTLASATSRLSAGALTGDKILAQTSGSSLVASAPSTITSGTASNTVPYVAIS